MLSSSFYATCRFYILLFCAERGIQGLPGRVSRHPWRCRHNRCGEWPLAWRWRVARTLLLFLLLLLLLSRHVARETNTHTNTGRPPLVPLGSIVRQAIAPSRDRIFGILLRKKQGSFGTLPLQTHRYLSPRELHCTRSYSRRSCSTSTSTSTLTSHRRFRIRASTKTDEAGLSLLVSSLAPRSLEPNSVGSSHLGLPCPTVLVLVPHCGSFAARVGDASLRCAVSFGGI
mmetsp:Transcript_4232/g.9166  ORF Transcript_4232/g.9166 Transcript_4232/m.9166 type:complete len:229 (+) Transcript_4232:1568-2254(+)